MPSSRIGFVTEGGGSWAVWDRFLAIDGHRAYHLGNICNTCSFFFERLDGANSKIEIEETATALRAGVASLADPLTAHIGVGLPDGEYLTCLLDTKVELVRPGEPNAYFAKEQIAVWGVDGFWGLPHHPKVPYYRAGEVALDPHATLFHFIVPMFPDGWLDQPAVSTYVQQLECGERPTAVALAVLDVKAPAWLASGAKHFGEHWCLAHYLMDGHHKMLAASRVGRPLTMVSFLAVAQGISSREQIERVASLLVGDEARTQASPGS